jgi:hypothetical protein
VAVGEVAACALDVGEVDVGEVDVGLGVAELADGTEVTPDERRESVETGFPRAGLGEGTAVGVAMGMILGRVLGSGVMRADGDPLRSAWRGDGPGVVLPEMG